jgi:ribulose-5-phosphate 4-epimerase/fuculose-1-phosphate aldolase
MDMNGTIWNDKKPSKESVMHLECYKKRDDISCIIHLHPVYSIAATCLETADASGAMPVYTPGYALRINHIPMIPYMMPGSLELAKAVADVVESRNSLLLANHGVVAVGNNLESAMGLIEEIEENAQITFLLNGKGVPMTEQQIREIRMKEGRK